MKTLLNSKLAHEILATQVHCYQKSNKRLVKLDRKLFRKNMNSHPISRIDG
ncbi:hypothetical protein ACO2J1_16500 [Leptospira interrogans]|uniref:hypothetical protein n=1 Tax=Leptospira interrogans TaxID=173 RepID=UPI000292799B|nr:hypothetical protein LEP1GSC069_2269 [Leptospira interrogans serovar Canicola str. Fiocruz LV133]EMN75795.1 hypothetical protein LEP1GSC102_1027 [Leptospira interrogans str. UI 09600]